MAGGASHNVQNEFLNRLRVEDVAVTVFLVNGVKLRGVIAAFDSFSVLLRREGVSQLVYKHAISTVVPARPFRVSDSAEGADGEAG